MSELTTIEENLTRRFNIDVWDLHNSDPELAREMADGLNSKNNDNSAAFLARTWCKAWIEKHCHRLSQRPANFTLDFLTKEMASALNLHCFQNPF